MHGCKRDAVHGFHYAVRACVEECVDRSKEAGCFDQAEPPSGGWRVEGRARKRWRVSRPRVKGRMTRAVEGVRPQLVRGGYNSSPSRRGSKREGR